MSAASPRGSGSLRAAAGLAWRQLRRDLKSGDIRILLAALVLAVVAVTAVGFVTDRAARALTMEANRLLGGDAVLRGDRPIEGAARDAARSGGLRVADTVELTSMIRVGDGNTANLRLGDVRALGAGFPLRGTFRVRGVDDAERTLAQVPVAGTAWLSRAGADTLGARLGDSVHVGELKLRLVGLVTQEPDASMDYFNVAPKVFINLADLPATGLVQEGSRLGYRLVVAGDAGAVEKFTKIARDNLGRGQRLETIGQARPEIRSALDRAGRFLGLAALVSVVLAAVAVAMAARRHSARHLSGAAVMRCLGASQRTLVAIHVGEMLLLGLLASALGVAIAFALQWAIGGWLGGVLKLSIPPAGWMPALQGLGVGMVVLLAFGAPPVLALRRVSALRVLRRDLDATEPSAWAVAIAGIAGLAALLWWKAGSATLATAMLVGIGATLAVLGLLAWLLILLVRHLRPRLRGSLRYGLANVSRRAATSIAQVSALGLGLMALLLLTFVRTDLLDRWQLSLAKDAPNRFIINVQTDQVDGVREFIRAQGVAPPTLFPMVRARLVAHNGRTLAPADAAGAPASAGEGDDADQVRAQRRREREFNLSTVAAVRADNRIVAGKFWQGQAHPAPQFSVEEDFAESLDWKVGDRIAFDVAGRRVEAPITSLRSVDWESFRPNFFVVASPGTLDGLPASHITAVSVPASRPRFTAELVARYPNLSVIDVEAVLQQVRATGDQVSTVVQVVFWFSFAAGLLVLMAAISASQDERLLEGGVMRVLGGSRRQLRMAQASEFAAIGLLSGLVAAIAASILSGVVAKQVFDLPWTANWTLAAVGGGLGMCAALAAGLFATRRVLDAPPSVTLRELQG
ncbi:ABC transporter permease [Agrilutibacter solisilvae]|uniref:FtsX-like permease family protein n=1 Tax=Agrilutibacter solisilvae TaxID=2763317 RepID=A0A974Y3E8_9GAMM|nr:FtsX-like permease family protein [Lysobacter solisilvae]QSX77071.1 FtsX-like permease family protein [Lysobacter solisilvae]